MNLTCSGCGLDLGKPADGPMDPVAVAECKELHNGFVPVKATANVLCDDCYEKYKAWLATRTPEELAELEAGARAENEKYS